MRKRIAKRKGRTARRVGGTWSRIVLALAGLGLVGLLGGCASKGTMYAEGMPDPALGNPDDIPDAVPRVEPKSKYGNMDTYVVNGRRYYTKDSSAGHVERGVASWYGRQFHGRKTSSGERYDMYGMTAAHKTLPLPTYARVTNMENGRSAVVKINDRGPFHGPRVIDLSYAAATKLGVVQRGTAPVEVRAIDPRRPGSDPGPFLAGASRDSRGPLVARNGTRAGWSAFDDDRPGAPASTGGRRRPGPSLEGEDDWLEGTRIVEGGGPASVLGVAAIAASAQPEYDPEPESAFGARLPGPAAPVRTAPPALAARVSQPERPASPPQSARIARASQPAPAAPAPQASLAAARARDEARERAFLAALAALDAQAAAPAPALAARVGGPSKDATKPAGAVGDAPKVAAATPKTAPKVVAAPTGKDAAKVAASPAKGGTKKDSAKVAATATKAAPKVAAAAKKGGPKEVAAGQGLYLQVGAFGDRGNAERLRKRLSPHLASQVRVQSPAGPGSSLYKVRVGPFGSEGEARKVSAKLASLGVERPRRVAN